MLPPHASWRLASTPTQVPLLAPEHWAVFAHSRHAAPIGATLQSPVTPFALPFSPLWQPNQIQPAQEDTFAIQTAIPATACGSTFVEDLEELAHPAQTPCMDPTKGETPEQRLSRAFLAAAVDGSLYLRDLPQVLLSAECKAAAREVESAIRRHLPTPDDPNAVVTLPQALAVFGDLQDADADGDERTAPATPNADQDAQRSDLDALYKLISTVVIILLISAGVVSGLAIMWLWMESTSQNQNNLGTNLNILQDMFQLMLHDNFANSRKKLGIQYALMISTVVEQMGYQLSQNFGRNALNFAAQFLRLVIEEWWQVEGQAGIVETAQVLAAWVGLLFKQAGDAGAERLVEQFNTLVLPVGQELVITRWANGSNSSVQFLTALRYSDQCVNNQCGSDPDAALPSKLALSGLTGFVLGPDYRPHEVLAGYTYIPTARVGVVYKVDIEVVMDRFFDSLKVAFDAMNAQIYSQGQELLLGRAYSNGTRVILTTLIDCDSNCVHKAQQGVQNSNTLAMSQALNGVIGVVDTVDYHGVEVIAGCTGVPAIGLGLVLKVSRKTFEGTVMTKLASILNSVNSDLPGSEELELAQIQVVGGVSQLVNLTARRFASDCANHTCGVSPYLALAAANCSTGAYQGPDYRRTVDVTAGYTCMADLSSYVSYKVDQAELDQDAVTLAVSSANNLNAAQPLSSSFEVEIGVPRAGLARESVRSSQDVRLLTAPRQGGQCPGGVCSGPAEPLQYALRVGSGLLYGEDYRGVSVLASTAYLSSLGIGLEAQVDISELIAPILSAAFILLGVTIGAILICTLLLAFYTQHMVKSMMHAEEEGRAAIIAEKQRFGVLVGAMYPKYVIDRVLAGDRQIVEIIPHTAVFFSDIYDFTSASNRITSEELVNLMGYTYGVMDKVADYFHVTKVKTVGDAYVAVAGLPSTESSNCCLDMLHFASCVAQIFSSNFDHPSEGRVLALLGARTEKRRLARQPAGSHPMTHGEAAGTASQISGSNVNRSDTHFPPSSEAPSRVSGVSGPPGSAADVYSDQRKIRCIMSYGIAEGPVTAGVLQGKSPMFDIWGRTVNLASRMQTTSPPGRIQVAASFYRAVAVVPAQPYLFEPSHTQPCKGFGLVSCYYVNSTHEAAPEALQIELGLEPNLGPFFYVNAVPEEAGAKRPAPTLKPQPPVPGVQPTRPIATLIQQSDPLVLLDIDDC